jgi:hypothetical protein
MPTLRVCQNVGLQTPIGIRVSALTTAGGDQAGDPYEKIPAVRHCCSAAAVVDCHFTLWFSPTAGLTRRVCSRVLQLCYREVFAMAAAGRNRDIAIRVMVTAKEQAEIRKAANKAAMPMSVYVRAKALEASRGAR